MGIFSGRDHAETTPSGMNVENVREDVPAFGRHYSAQLDDGRSIKVTMKTFMGSRMCDGELDQAFGRWVLFDPHAIADKMLDPNLVPKVKAACEEIFALDRAYMASNRPEFVDEHGTTWRRD
jgi:hypothetical protein